MFIGSGQVHDSSSWHVFYDHSLQGCELSICVQSYNPKSPISIGDVHLIEGGVYFLDFPVRNMVDHGKEKFLLRVRKNGIMLTNNISSVMTISL